jgi:hypothetical protein
LPWAKVGIEIEPFGIEGGEASHFSKGLLPGFAQQHPEYSPADTLSRILWTDVYLQNVAGGDVQCTETYWFGSVLGHDDVPIGDVPLVTLRGPSARPSVYFRFRVVTFA